MKYEKTKEGRNVERGLLLQLLAGVAMVYEAP